MLGLMTIFVIVLLLLLYGSIQAGVHEGEHLFDFEPLVEEVKLVISVVVKGVRRYIEWVEGFL